MDTADLDTPMSALRSLASPPKESENGYAASRITYDPIFPPLAEKECQRFEHDPVAQGLGEAQQAFDMYVHDALDLMD
jgi:hypothetical protein